LSGAISNPTTASADQQAATLGSFADEVGFGRISRIPCCSFWAFRDPAVDEGRQNPGGPVCDSRGRIWGIQSRTAHIPLGFNPTVTVNGRTFDEHQFINLGWAVHVRLILDALRARGVEVDISAD